MDLEAFPQVNPRKAEGSRRKRDPCKVDQSGGQCFIDPPVSGLLAAVDALRVHPQQHLHTVTCTVSRSAIHGRNLHGRDPPFSQSETAVLARPSPSPQHAKDRSAKPSTLSKKPSASHRRKPASTTPDEPSPATCSNSPGYAPGQNYATSPSASEYYPDRLSQFVQSPGFSRGGDVRAPAAGIVRVGATLPSRDPEASALASSARQARDGCDTQPGQPLACTAREATEAAMRPVSNPGTDDLRSPGR